MPATVLDRSGQIDLVLSLMHMGAVERRLELEGLTDGACFAMLDAAEGFSQTCEKLGLDPQDPEDGALIVACAREALA